MITVKVVYIGLATTAVGASEEEVQISTGTLRELWAMLSKRHGEVFKSLVSFDTELSAYVVLVNGRNIRLLHGLNTPLQDGDRVAVMAPFAGG
jgi:molybdopterin synthase sulfur carrier subunit